MKTIKRRDFIKTGLLAGGAVILSNKLSGSAFFSDFRSGYRLPENGDKPGIVTISSENPEVNLPRLLDSFGGISSFIAPGQTVGLLVNSPWRHTGFYTQPDMVLVLASLCLNAGASKTICIDPVQQSYWERGSLYSKYQPVIDKITFGSDRVETDIPKGIALKKAEVYKEFMEVDVYISVPVAKHHVGTFFSGNLKGMMGVSSPYTNRYMHSPDGEYTYDNHEHLAQCIADLNLVRQPDLCIMDASECAVSNGPAGPGETVKPAVFIAGKDPLAMDVYAASLLGFPKEDILTFHKASEHKLGEIDPGKVTLLNI